MFDFSQNGFKDGRYQETLDDDASREAICEFYGKWPQNSPCEIKFDEATCFKYTRDADNPEKVTLQYVFMDDRVNLQKFVP